MHSSDSLDWDELLKRIQHSGYQGPMPSEPCWIGDEETSEGLVDLILTGKKSATSTLLWEIEHESAPMPYEGLFEALLSFSNEFLGVIETVRVEVVPFCNVTGEYAALEGEGDSSLAYWRFVHWEIFRSVCMNIERTPILGMPVVCQEFKLHAPAVSK